MELSMNIQITDTTSALVYLALAIFEGATR